MGVVSTAGASVAPALVPASAFAGDRGAPFPETPLQGCPRRGRTTPDEVRPERTGRLTLPTPSVMMSTHACSALNDPPNHDPRRTRPPRHRRPTRSMRLVG